jgi:hypothetical protein
VSWRRRGLRPYSGLVMRIAPCLIGLLPILGLGCLSDRSAAQAAAPSAGQISRALHAKTSPANAAVPKQSSRGAAATVGGASGAEPAKAARGDTVSAEPLIKVHVVDVGTGLGIFVEGPDFSLVYDAGSNDDVAEGEENRF